mgnify:CR=1 FL=1
MKQLSEGKSITRPTGHGNPQIIKVELRPYWETEALDILDPGSIECTVAYGTLDQNEKNFALPKR